MVPASGSKIKKTLLYTARMRESDAADPSEAFPRWGNASVPEKHRQDRRVRAERENRQIHYVQDRIRVGI